MKSKPRVPSEENCLKKLDPDTQAMGRWLVHSGATTWESIAKISRRSSEEDFGRHIAIDVNDRLPLGSKAMACSIVSRNPHDWTLFDPDSSAGAKLLSCGCVARDGASYRMAESYLRCLKWLYGATLANHPRVIVETKKASKPAKVIHRGYFDKNDISGDRLLSKCDNGTGSTYPVYRLTSNDAFVTCKPCLRLINKTSAHPMRPIDALVALASAKKAALLALNEPHGMSAYQILEALGIGHAEAEAYRRRENERCAVTARCDGG